MNNEILLIKVNHDNLELACKIQNEIFPLEDGRQNFIEQLENASYRKEQSYYIVFHNEVPIGITGIYSYHEYPENAWLGWFGIIEEYRHKGYGGIVLDKTIELARKKKYTKFRLYTDEFAKNAHRLYKSRGLIEELYDNKDDKDEYFDSRIYIYSLSLTTEKIDLWNNKNIGLKEQGEKEHLKESISENNGIKILKEKDLNVLSIGISTSGSAEIRMAMKNTNCHITATTIDENGIKIVKKNILDKNLDGRIDVKLEDITKKTNYIDNYFDYIYARLVLHYLDNNQLESALNEIYRILKPTGKLFVVVRSKNAWEAKLEGTTYDNKTGLTKHPDIRTYGTQNVKYCYRRLHTIESITKFLKESGFKIKHTKAYDEYLSPDFNREKINEKASELIEVLAIK